MDWATVAPLLRDGGIILVLCINLWAIATGKVVTAREQAALKEAYDTLSAAYSQRGIQLEKLTDAHATLVSQVASNLAQLLDAGRSARERDRG